MVKLEIGNRLFAVYALYVLFVWGSDFGDFAAYLAGWPQPAVLSRVIAAAAVLFLCRWLRRRVSIPRVRMDFSAWIFVCFALAFFLFKAVRPDTSTDVEFYHLFLQTPGFKDLFGYNFAPAAKASAMYPLADHLIYGFRWLLGYRLGTVLNLGLTILIFFQVRDFYSRLWTIRLGRASVLAAVTVLGYHLVMQLGASYMIDLASVPFLLEMLRLLAERRQGEAPGGVYYFSSLMAFVLALKLNTLFYVFPMLLLYFFWYHRQLRVKNVVISFVLAVLPISIYALYALRETGNPLFPFYNAFFQSVYAPASNVMDDGNRWGPLSAAELFFWPLHLVFTPAYRLCEIPEPFALGHLGGVLGGFYFFGRGLLDRVWRSAHRVEYSLGFVFVLSVYVWTILSGYARYFLFGMLLANMILVRLFCYVRRDGARLVTGGLLVLLAMSPFFAVYETAIGHEWSWRDFDSRAYRLNFPRLLRDRHLAGTDQTAKIDAFLLLDLHGSGYAHALKPEVPCYSYWQAMQSAPAIREAFRQRLVLLWEQQRAVYDVHVPDRQDFGRYIENMDKAGLQIAGIAYLDGGVFMDSRPWLCRLRPSEQPNRVIHLDGERAILPVSGGGDRLQLRCIWGFLADAGPLPPGLTFSVTAIAAGGQRQLLYQESATGDTWRNLDQCLDVSGMGAVRAVEIACVQADGTVMAQQPANPLLLLNPLVQLSE